FFFQAEDGIRDRNVTGVQTCALPISIAELTRRGEPSLLFLHDQTVTGRTRRPATDDYLRALVAAQQVSSGSIFLVPHAMTDRARSEERRVGKECRARGWSRLEKEE